MGNEGSAFKGPTVSVPNEVVSNARKGTPFSHEEALKILQRYGAYDASHHGQEGITVRECKQMPEFTGNVFASDVIDFHADPSSKKIHPKGFMKICTIFYRGTPAKTKKLFLFDLFDVDKQKMLTHDEMFHIYRLLFILFDLFDVDKQKVLTHDGMFRIYKLLFSHAVSDDHILALTFSALNHPQLGKEGEVTRDEFVDMIPDSEIQEKFSIDFFTSDS